MHFQLDPFYVIPILFALVIGIIFIYNHNKKVSKGATPPQRYKTNKNVTKQSLLDNVKNSLLKADVGSKKTDEIISTLRNVEPSEFADELSKLLPKSKVEHPVHPKKKPHAIAFIGVNGVGKTTTIGKIAKQLTDQGSSVVLAAADTFRAAAADQLETWSKRCDSKLVKLIRNDGADAASVAFEAAKTAVESSADYLLIDTAGRMHNNSNLIEELKKILRAVEKNCEISEVILVIDGTSGQNAISQATNFSSETKVTGIAITKLDGSAKGGIVFKISQSLNIPVEFVGTGEGADQLEKFNAEKFVQMLIS